jgi:hypothetical protein
VSRSVGLGIAATLVLVGLGFFWGVVLLAAAVNPGYSHGRDYISTLAAHGAAHGWLGVVAIVAASGAMLATALLVRQLSRLAGISIALAGVGFLVVAFSRLECANGAAGCGLGGRFAISGATEVTHWTATTVSTVLLIAGIGLTGLALMRHGRTVAGVASWVAAAGTTAAFVAMGGQSPGEVQRLGVLIATGWLAAVAIASLARSRERR